MYSRLKRVITGILATHSEATTFPVCQRVTQTLGPRSRDVKIAKNHDREVGCITSTRSAAEDGQTAFGKGP
ncbi:hypothetical protein N657DRAFT_648032 [Parathielavia appendiculata]|uniref:Uncharacterized protein n=1 Tax=Parathielavia appendiculata TaxID=2587402 RepID=A0AAN6TUY8_9PEZI|nr:hypothetical protein N657DRAFT_648032 [Parathielavia appendiculata]